MIACRCQDCEAEFAAPDASALLCPTCQAREDRVYANDPGSNVPEDVDTRWKWSRSAMRERLGVTGERDE